MSFLKATFGIGAGKALKDATETEGFYASSVQWNHYLQDYGRIRTDMHKDQISDDLRTKLGIELEDITESQLSMYRTTPINDIVPLEELVDPLLMHYAHSVLEKARSQREGGIRTEPAEFLQDIQKSLPLARYGKESTEVIKSACRTYLADMMDKAYKHLGKGQSLQRMYTHQKKLKSDIHKFRAQAKKALEFYWQLTDLGFDLRDMEADIDDLDFKSTFIQVNLC